MFHPLKLSEIVLQKANNYLLLLIVSISTEERVQLAQTLRTTSLSRILRTIKMIKNRCEVVEQLRNLVFDLKKFSTEREHIQLAIDLFDYIK